MKLLLRGHDDRYAVEQLQLALFPEEPMEPVAEPFSGDGAVSSLHTGAVWLTATAEITLHGKTGRACRRLRAAGADVPARRRLLQNTYYEAAMCLREPPAWGSLSGVRPTKLTTRALLEGRTPAEAEKLLRTRYHVSPERSRLCVEASEATVQAAQLLRPQDVSVYVGIPFCPTRCAYCSFVSSSIERFSGLLEPYLDALVREIAHTGDLLRAAVKGGTELGIQAKKYMDAGELVPDQLVIDLVKERLAADDAQQGFILDGFPRNTAQAVTLDSELSAMGREIDCALLVDVAPEVIIDRLSSRRTCRACGYTGTAADATCPKCGGEMYQRDDDKPETIKNRLDVYEKSTSPLVDYYRGQGLLKSVNGDQARETVYGDVKEALGL